ncbi:MAG: hypothetical protein HQK76_11185 [Desulfobacterales bacterium]|nr:hypothetical protein [Desulfobacterales bacterium]
MTYWGLRDELSRAHKLRRSYYELLRDGLDEYIIDYALTESYKNFKEKNIPYPFVEKRELKPKARLPNTEYEAQNSFLIIFMEDLIPDLHKKYIRFFDVNKTLKSNLLQTDSLSLDDEFDRSQKYIESAHFFNFLKMLLPIDYALLIQRDSATKSKDRYAVTHFHVKIDWPIADAAEDLARSLRYISKDLYEKGDKYAEDIQRKFFEYYGMPLTVGGRRTAAAVAAQYLKRIPCISTIYVGSSESRYLLKVCEQGISKIVLMKFTENEVAQISGINNFNLDEFKKNYVVLEDETDLICIFKTSYAHTAHARYPEDGKLREINPDLYWITVDAQQILPKPGVWEFPPINANIIYA